MAHAAHTTRPARLSARCPRLRRIACCASLGTLLASCTPGKHLYVAPDGADANTGTKGAPFLTLARADAAALPGYTIHVAPGLYTVTAPGPHSAGITTSRDGTASARIKFVSDVRWGAKIVVEGTGIAWRSKGSYVDIDGFDISGSGRHGILADGAHLTIRHNVVHDLTISGGCSGSGGAAIDTNGGAGNVLIQGNVVRNIGVAMRGRCRTVQGIYIANPHNIVVNNIVSGVAAAGIQQWHGATASTIVNNTVFGCKIGILIGGGDADTLPQGSEDNYVANNIVYDNITYGIVEGGKVGANNRYLNNLVHASGTAIRATGQVSGTRLDDPQFRMYRADGTGDYRLRDTSPALLRHTDREAEAEAQAWATAGTQADTDADAGARARAATATATVNHAIFRAAGALHLPPGAPRQLGAYHAGPIQP